MAIQFHNIINNEARGSSKHHQTVDPRTEEDLWDAPLATASDLQEAVEAAQNAFPAWAAVPWSERAALLEKMAVALEDTAEELAGIVMRETGKSQLLGQHEVSATVGQTRYFASLTLPDEVTFEDDGSRIVQTHSPLGVVGAICPWNFPLILCNLKVVQSLLTGNCVIIKPSPFTPYAVMKWVEQTVPLFPPGVLQVLNGGAELGALMTTHPGIQKITFTGTIATGKKVMAACSKTLKKVTLELAGNDACIVLPDADLDDCVPKIAGGAFFNAGQMCVATKRVYVHEDMYDEFLKRFVEQVTGGSLAINAEPGVPSIFGPLSNKLQFDVVRGILDDCKKNKYDIVAGGEIPEGKGYWMTPTVVAKPPEDSVLVKEEQFGPIIPILTYTDEADAIRRANLANAGLGASVYGKDLAHAERVARALEAGGVWINMSEKPNPGGYFSGWKESGVGGEMGKQGLLSYCYTKAMHFSKK